MKESYLELKRYIQIKFIGTPNISNLKSHDNNANTEFPEAKRQTFIY